MEEDKAAAESACSWISRFLLIPTLISISKVQKNNYTFHTLCLCLAYTSLIPSLYPLLFLYRMSSLCLMTYALRFMLYAYALCLMFMLYIYLMFMLHIYLMLMLYALYLCSIIYILCSIIYALLCLYLHTLYAFSILCLLCPMLLYPMPFIPYALQYYAL